MAPRSRVLLCLQALGAASGIAYLHSFNPPIIHRDVRSPNLLITRSWTIKVISQLPRCFVKLMQTMLLSHCFKPTCALVDSQRVCPTGATAASNVEHLITGLKVHRLHGCRRRATPGVENLRVQPGQEPHAICTWLSLMAMGASLHVPSCLLASLPHNLLLKNV
jgi:hypothetical protein